MNNEITLLLKEVSDGNNAAKNALAKMVYSNLKAIAANKLKNESWQHTLTITSLAHEAFLKVDQSNEIIWKNRKHYYGAIAEAMRRILIDRARYHNRKKRVDGKCQLSIDENDFQLKDVQPDELIWLNDTLDALENYDSELAIIVKLKFFIGLSSTEISQQLNVSSRTIDRKWAAARAWLIVEKETLNN